MLLGYISATVRRELAYEIPAPTLPLKHIKLNVDTHTKSILVVVSTTMLRSNNGYNGRMYNR